MNLRLYIQLPNAQHYVGNLIPRESYLELPPVGGPRGFAFDLLLDHYGLSQIEKLRNGKDLNFMVEGSLMVENAQQPPLRAIGRLQFQYRIAKSDWVENILQRIKFKDVVLVEIPKIEKPEFEETENHLNDSWRQYARGEYDKVFTECRKALESLGKKIKDAGYEKMQTDSSRKVPDWGKLLGDENLGDILGTIDKKILGFVAVGAHAGKSINREDADFALMITHALVSLIVNKLD